MAVDDLWRKRGPDGNLVPSERDGRGKRWRVRFTDPDGQPRTRLFDLKGDAERYDLKVRSEVARGEFVDPASRRLTVREYAEPWRLAQPHEPNTARRVRSHVERHIYPALGSRPIGAVRFTEVQAFVTGLGKHLKPDSVRIIKVTLTAIFRAAVRDRKIPFDPTEGVKLPEVTRPKVVPLTVEQVEALVDGLPRRYRVVGIVAAGTGMRQGEVFGLQVRDVDFLRRSLRVERQVQPHGVGPLKKGSACRAIPVGQVLIDALAAHLAAYPAGPDDFVFRTRAGLPLHKGRFQWAWQQARTAAGLPNAGMHELRHFYASALIRAGRSVKEVSERLGHTNAAITLNVYSHLWPEDSDGTRQAIDDLFKNETPRLRKVD